MPELRDYIRAYWSQRWLITAIVVVATGASMVTAWLQPSRFAVSESFAINRINVQPSTDYQYDGYYSLLANDQFATTVVSWFSVPSFLNDVYTTANVDPMASSINSLPSRFKVKKYSAQNIAVRFTETNEQRARLVGQALRDDMGKKAALLNQNAIGKPLFEVISGEPYIAPTKPSPYLWGAIALILSAGFAFMLAALRYYLQNG